MDLKTAFRRLTFATALWAFLALCFTGEIHFVPGLLFFAALATAWQWPRIGLRVPAVLWTVTSLCVFGAALYGWFYIGHRMYSATYLFFYLEANRLLTARTNRDYVQIYGLTFFHVLAASVSTESALFAPVLAVYVFLAIGALMVFTIKRDAEATFEERKVRGARGNPALQPFRVTESDGERIGELARSPWLTRGMGWSLVLTTLLVLFVGTAIFWVVPRSATKSFFSPFGTSARAPRKSGFAESIHFGGVGEIQSDPSIVMRAEPRLSSGTTLPEFLRIRGTALDEFTGYAWRKAPESVYRRTTEINSSILSLPPLNRIADDPGRGMRFHMTLEPEKTGYLFVPDQPATVILDREYPVEVDSTLWSLRRKDTRLSPVSYDTLSLLPADQMNMVPVPVHARDEYSGLATAVRDFAKRLMKDAESIASGSTTSRYQGDNSTISLSVPPFPGSEVIHQTAREWAGGITDPGEIARTIENRFKTTFEYSLKSDFSTRPDHLAYFVDSARSGHCEYFATAMALMLRTLGVPSRVVNGYLTDEWARTGGRFIVRQEHAHSWVEAQTDTSGAWTTYDPTPPSGIGSNRTGQSAYHLFSRIIDTMKMVWYDSIIDFGLEDQRSGLSALLQRFSKASARTQVGFEAMQNWWGSGALGEGARSFATIAFKVIGVCGAMLVLAALLAWILKKRRAVSRKLTTQTVREDLLPYLSLLREAEPLFPRSLAETPLAWARTLAAHPQDDLQDLVPVTEAYYAARYDGSPLEAEIHQRIERIRQQIAELRTAQSSRSSRSGSFRKLRDD